jgi:hypothetical protein
MGKKQLAEEYYLKSLKIREKVKKNNDFIRRFKKRLINYVLRSIMIILRIKFNYIFLQ